MTADEYQHRSALDDLFAVVYQELRKLASAVSRGDGSATPTLTPTALVHEAWLKLAGSPHLAQTSRTHFKRLAARAMRQVLVEAARRRLSKKRGGGAVIAIVPLDDDIGAPVQTEQHLLALDEALQTLARLNPRQASVVEGRFFGGLDVNELAELLDVSATTIGNDWRVARAWLHAELRPR